MSQPADAVVPRLQFDVEPYKADGGFPMWGAIQLMGVLGTAGIILGVISSFISNYFWLIVLFPLAIGLGLGLAGSLCLKRFKVRSPKVCGLIGFLAGCFAMLAMHYVDYRSAVSQIDAGLGVNAPIVRALVNKIDEAKAKGEELPEELQETVAELEKEPHFLQLLRMDSVWKYIDFKAQQGVELKRAARGGAGANLGYVGSYIYFGFEAFLVGIVAFFMMLETAGNPYCRECGQWKVKHDWGPVDQAHRVAQSISAGGVQPCTSGQELTAPQGVVSAYACPTCQSEGNIDVKVQQFTFNAKGERSDTQLAFVTFPGTAWEPLQVACNPPPVTPAPAESSAVESDAAKTS